ncbi:MAG: hypothetical protein ACOVN0_11710 [Niveispirillum sp.]|uniref:hypothetical protein n=1 Tax=Niveispirillum sp. TaxID=1917217 RepID=UPI003BA55C52
MSAPVPPGLTGITAPTGPAPAGPGLVPLADVMIRALPDKLAGLDRALVVSGQVVAQEDGKATIRTAAGDVTVETPTPLPTDRAVTLRIPPQVPGTPPRATAMAPPQAQAPAPPVSMPATSQTSTAPAPTATAQTLPQIQPGATIAAIVVAAIQPRPPSPPPPISTANAAGGSSPVDLLVSAGDRPLPPPTGPAPAPPATPSPAPTPLPTAQPVPPPVAGASLPPLASLLGNGAAAPSAAAVSASPEQPPSTTGANPADAAETMRPSPPSPGPEVAPDRDAARLARLARYNIPAAPTSGLFAFSDLDGPPSARNPVVEARLRGPAAPAPATAPPTSVTLPTPVPGPAAAPPTGPGRTETPAPTLPDDAAPPRVGTPGDLARLRGAAASAPPTTPPTAPPTVPATVPASDGAAPAIPRSPAATPAPPPIQDARVRDGTPLPMPGTAPPTIPSAPAPTAPTPPTAPTGGSIPQAAPVPDGIPLARIRDGHPASPPTAPSTVPKPVDAAAKPPVPQQTAPAEIPQMARLRDLAAPSPPTAAPTISTEPAPAPPARPGGTPMMMPVQEARARDPVAPSPPTTPATAPATTPASGPAPVPRPPQAVPDLPVQQARVRGDLPPAPPTAPPTAPTSTEAPTPGRPPEAAPAASPPPGPPASVQPPRAAAGDPAPAPARPVLTPAPVPGPEPETQMARVRGDAPPVTPTAPPTAPAAPTVPTRPAALPNGQPVQLRVLAVEGSALPAAAAGSSPTLDNAPDALPANSVSGTLVGNTAQGHPVVTTPQGTLVLRARTDLPPGTNLTLSLEIPQNRELATILPPLDPAQGGDWPALREVMSALLAADPAMARAVAANILPQPTKRLTTNLTFFLAALRGGDAAGWLGNDATELLNARGGARLLAQLRDDFQAAARQAAEPTPDGWRAMPIPFGTPDQVMRAQLHVRSATDQEQAEARNDGRGAPKRFLMDLNFSRIGPMQLDGMVWTGRFDLMIRTQSLLPAELRQSIGTIFRDSLETVGYAGTIGFQTGAHAWARVQATQRGSGVRA